MTPANMNDKLDLSKLSQDNASYVRDIDEAGFEEVARLSLKHPVVVELTLFGDDQTKAVDEALIELTNQAEGRWLLARVDVKTNPRISQALGVKAVPTVIVLLGGQVAPLFQGTRDKDDIKAALDQIVSAAVGTGMTGRAEPIPGGITSQAPTITESEDTASTTPTIDPRFAAADAALTAGDFPKALAEFDKLLTVNPRDAEALAGKAQVGLLLRLSQLDPAQVLVKAGADLDDIEAQLAAADVEMAKGQSEAAFSRLNDAVRRTSDKSRETVKNRLVELFAIMPPGDPTVAKARRELTTAIF